MKYGISSNLVMDLTGTPILLIPKFGSKNFVNAHPFGRLRKLVPVYSVAVMEQIPWCTIPGESFEKLSRGPFLSGTGSDGEVKRTSAIMVENQEDEEELEGHRWDEEEVYQVLALRRNASAFMAQAPSTSPRFNF